MKGTLNHVTRLVAAKSVMKAKPEYIHVGMEYYVKESAKMYWHHVVRERIVKGGYSIFGQNRLTESVDAYEEYLNTIRKMSEQGFIYILKQQNDE